MENSLNSEELEQRNSGFMAKLSAGFSSLKKRVTAKRWKGVESLRQTAFQAFFVGIRSRKLSQRNARVIWDQLDSLERMLRDPKEEYLEELERQYSYIAEVMKALESVTVL